MNDIVPGDRVKIERGPFAEFICTVDDIQDNRRAWVLIDLLQRQTKSVISLNNLSDALICVGRDRHLKFLYPITHNRKGAIGVKTAIRFWSET